MEAQRQSARRERPIESTQTQLGSAWSEWQPIQINATQLCAQCHSFNPTASERLPSSLRDIALLADMWHYVDGQAGPRPPPGRCLEWGGYGGSIFASLCATVDVLVYATPFGPAKPPARKDSSSSKTLPKNAKWWHADAMTMASYLPRSAFDLVIANSVFEHLEQPFDAMGQVAALLKPGGYLFWHTPFQYPEHGVPRDYFRYSAAGARLVAEAAGLEVQYSHADGDGTAVVGNVLGLSAKYWRATELEAGSGVPHGTAAVPEAYLSTRMIARKPHSSTVLPLVRGQAALNGSRMSHRGAARNLVQGGRCASASSVAFADSVRRELRERTLPIPMPAQRGSTITPLAHFRAKLLSRKLGQMSDVRKLRCLHWRIASWPEEPADDAVDVAISQKCGVVDVIIGSALERSEDAPQRDYDLVLSTATFARSRNPWEAMRRIAGLLRSGGFLLWHEPFGTADKGPDDYFRFTTAAARSLAEHAGLQLSTNASMCGSTLCVSQDGGYGAVLSDALGLSPTSRMWHGQTTMQHVRGGHYLATWMVATKLAPGYSSGTVRTRRKMPS